MLDSMVDSEDLTQALKLKIPVSKQEAILLNEMFWKWATLCNIASISERIEELKEPDPAKQGVWFNKTQVGQATVDLKNLRSAMQKQKQRIEYELDRLITRRDDLQETIGKPEARQASPDRKDLFKPKKWVEHGYLQSRFHRLSYYSSRVKELQRTIEKKDKTIEKISKGVFVFKPTRVCLHQNNIKINFKRSEISIDPFEPREPKTLRVIFSPEQPLIGEDGGKSSKKSAEYLKKAILNLIAYSINSMLFGLSNSERMLATAKKQDKLLKFQEKKKKKEEKWAAKTKNVEKLLGRKLTDKELRILTPIHQEFVQTWNVKINTEYRSLLELLAEEIFCRDFFVCLNKYPALIRKPKQRFKYKKIKNLKPEQWDYFVQFGYSPILFENKKIKIKTILGVDRGIKSLLAISVFDPTTKKFVINRLLSNDLEILKRQYKDLKNSIRDLERKVRAQNDVHLHENQMKKQLRGIKNKTESILHNASADVIKIAKENESEIVVEALADMKQHGRKKNTRTKNLNYTLSLFDYAKLGQLINYKAKREGIPVFVVDPANTSKTCNQCLLLDKNNENFYKRGIGFEHNGKKKTNYKIGICANHEKPYQIDADLNAARVIALCRYKSLNNPRPFGIKLAKPKKSAFK